MPRGDLEGRAVGQTGHGLRGHHRPAALGLVVGSVALLAVVPACSSTSTPTAASTSTTVATTTAPTSVTFQQGSAAEVANCEADAKSLEVALEAYMAQKGAFPAPPSPWSAPTYAANFTPLMSAYLHSPPSTKFYVIEYDSSGHLWIAPPGSYGATYNPGQDFDAHPDICLAAVG